MDIACTISRVNDKIERDPYNSAIAKVLNDEFTEQEFGEARLVRATGISRATLRRYLSGERDIRVGELRKIAAALRIPMSQVIAKAERGLKQGE